MPIAYPLPWPAAADGRPLAPASLDLHVTALTRGGGPSLTGDEQVVVSPAARWTARLTMPTLRGTDVLTWRGFIGAMQGRFGSVLMPAFEAGRQPWPVDRYGIRRVPALARNPALAGSAYAVDPAKDAAADILVVVDRAAPINATSLTLRVDQGSALRAGHRFTLNGRLHEVLQAQPASDTLFTVDLRPWLLVAAAAGDVAEFRAPLCPMRLASDTEGSGDLDMLRSLTPTVNLIEAH